MTKRTSGPVGTLEKKKVDITFVQSGKTTREEVVQRLGWVDSGIKEDHLFVARWASSGSGWVWFLPGDCRPWCDDNMLSRDWSVHNFVVEFDESGLARNSRDVPTSELLSSFQQWVAQSDLKAAELQTPSELEVSLHRVWSASTTAKLVLSLNSFGFEELSKPKRNFHVHPALIREITSLVDVKEGQAPNLALIKMNMKFKENTAAGKHITLLISPRDLLVLVKYLHAPNGTLHAP